MYAIRWRPNRITRGTKDWLTRTTTIPTLDGRTEWGSSLRQRFSKHGGNEFVESGVGVIVKVLVDIC